MNYKLVKTCKNVFAIDKENNTKHRDLKIEDITAMTLIVVKPGFEIQGFESDTSDTQVYYIQKYNLMLTGAQAIDFCNNNPQENFLLVHDNSADIDDIWFYVTSEPDNLTVHCFHAVGGGHMTLFAILHNVPGKSQWLEPKPLEGTRCVRIISAEDENKRYGYRSHNERNKLYFTFNTSSYNVEHGHLINIKELNGSACTQEIMRQCLRVTGKTRITRWDGDYSDRYFRYEAGRKPEIEDESIIKRYGFEKPDEYSYNYRYGGEWMWKEEFFDSELPESDWNRVKARLEAKLEAMDNNDDDAYSKVLKSYVLLISDPIPGHRRPSYHLVAGFRSNHITEIVELSRGELLMKDMTPENIYILFSDGHYRLALYNIKTAMRELICSKNVEIDAESFNKWADERSLHPELLRKLSTSYFDNIDLETIKLFNRLPFGSLLIDQLITSGHSNLAVNLAEDITKKAYDFNVYCGQLSDLFPECNGEATSLYKILNISKSTAKYLFEDTDNAPIAYFIAKYKAIHHFGANMVMTDEAKTNIETYLYLFNINRHKFTLSFGQREFDFLDYPKIAKQVVRMDKKIKALNICRDDMRDISNKYDEIVRAYASFLDYSKIVPENERAHWTPEYLKIFVEFSLTGTPEHPLNPIDEVSSREKDANKALKIYQDKANEKIKQENEEKFAFRRTQINKLRSYAELEKQKNDFNDYTVIAPTQIYGDNVVGSVEKEASDLSHCLFRCYTNRIISGDYTAMWLRLRDKSSESLITIGITSDGRIEQTRGLDDRDATPEEAKAIAAWAQTKKGMVTFKSEGADVMPGGWPKNVPVPSLPKPDKEWLNKLKLNHETNY